VPGDFQFRIEFQELEVGLGDVGNEGELDAAPGFFAGEKLGASGFV